MPAKPGLSRRHRRALAAARRGKDREFGIKLLVSAKQLRPRHSPVRSSINPSCMQLSHRPLIPFIDLTPPVGGQQSPQLTELRAGGRGWVALAEQVERIDIEIDIGGI